MTGPQPERETVIFVRKIGTKWLRSSGIVGVGKTIVSLWPALHASGEMKNYLRPKIAVGTTITSFRKRFNNHKNSLGRYEMEK